MKPETTPRTVIVAALDGSAATEQVILTTLRMARALRADVHLAHVVDIGASGSGAVAAMEAMREGQALLEEAKARMSEELTSRITVHIALDTPSRYVIQLANDLGADLVIVGTHRKGMLDRLFLGSVSQAVVRGAPCPTLVARAKEHASTPEIEPPCPACRAAQEASGGETLWCAQHSEKHARARLHYEVPASFGTGAMFLRPNP
ncbi:MAG: universal stress protein [Labilithrix sp.]|nr:universal stress protein [Labilithrix sp.]MCW5832274.1 universal stress protein [Labilithrix sp.]